MEPPAVTRRRRPFLAPVWVTIVAMALVAGVAYAVFSTPTTTLVVVARSVDKDPGAIEDAPLSTEGEQRAQRLAQLLGGAQGVGQLDAVYVSDSRRAQQTVAPVAQRLGKHPIVLPANDPEATAARVMDEHEGGSVLVVINGASLPGLVHELSGIDLGRDEEPDALYILSLPPFGRASVLRMRY